MTGVKPGPLTPLKDAQDWLRVRLAEGEHCPCCTQFVKVYRRTVNSGMARALILMYQAGGTDDWVHKPTVLKGIGAAARDESLLRYWDVLEHELDVVPNGRSGWWRVTELGEKWINGEIQVPKWARIFDGKCYGLDRDHFITIQEALGHKFDLAELMAAS